LLSTHIHATLGCNCHNADLRSCLGNLPIRAEMLLLKQFVWHRFLSFSCTGKSQVGKRNVFKRNLKPNSLSLNNISKGEIVADCMG